MDSPTTKRRYVNPLQGGISPFVVSSPFRSVCVLVHSREEFFPAHDIRLIAVSDGVDSDEGDNEFTPFRNIMNEWYAKDISKKRRIVNKLKGNSGVPLSPPPYEYMKDPDNVKRWIVDEEAAVVVRRIYQMALD